MLAPIFTWEVQRTMQRRWFHAARVLLAAIPLSVFLWHLADLTSILSDAELRRSLNAVLGKTREYQHLIMTMHFAWIFLLAPLLAAGPILQEKRQKTLDLLLTTQQRSADIIIGHWLAANVKLIILTTPVIPLLIWIHAFGEASPMTWIVAWIGCTCLVALPLTAWPTLVVVYARQSSAALLFSYAGNGLLLIATPILFRDAQLALWPYAVYDAAFWRNFVLFVTAPTIACVLIAIWRLRPAFGAAPERATRRSAIRSTLTVSDQPILWKQTHCNDLLVPSFIRRMPRWVRVLGFVTITTSIAMIPDYTSGAWCLVAVFLAFPVISLLWANVSISSEQESGTWDSLRLTLLSAEEIVHETLQIITPRLRLYWFALLPAIAVSAYRDYWNLLMLPIWLAAGAAIYHAAVAGLSTSFQSTSSWGGIIYAIATFGMHSGLLSALSFFGAAGISFMTCMFSCMALGGPVENYIGIIFFAMNVILFCVVFLTFLHIMLRNRSSKLIFWTIEHLVKVEGFDWAAPPTEDAPVESS